MASSVVTIKKPTVSQNIKTTVSTDYTSGTTLYVDSTAGFSNGNYIVVGEPGLEKTEITNLTAAPGTNYLTVSALSYPHARGTSIYYVRWDKYSLEYRTSSTGTWTVYGSMPTDLRYDSSSTEYRDTTAVSGYQWRYRYYSTESSIYSDYSDTISTTGWTEQQVGYMIRNVRKIANDLEGQTLSDIEIIRFFNAAQTKIYTIYDRWWFLLKIGTATTTTASTASYALPTDFGRMHSVMYYHGDDHTTVPLKYISWYEYDYNAQDNDASTDDDVMYYTLYPPDTSSTTGYLKVWPIPAATTTSSCTITPRYYKTFTTLDSYGDTTEVPIGAILEDYAIAQIFFSRGDNTKGQYYDKQFRQQIDLLKLMQRKQVGPPRSLWQYKGHGAEQRYFGGRVSTSDSETHW